MIKQMVVLDSSLKDLKPWPEIARLLQEALENEFSHERVTIALRAMTQEDRIALIEHERGSTNFDASDGADAAAQISCGDNHFEFLLDIDNVKPPDPLENLSDWVWIILDPVDQYLHEDGTSPCGL